MTCDRCGAAGKVRFVMQDDTDLVFCAHHSRAYEQDLLELVKNIDLLTDEDFLLVTI